MVIKHGTGDYFFVLCWNATILSFHFILTKPQIKGNYLLGHCLVPVSLQSRSSRPMTHLKVWCAMFQTTWFLVLLLCSVLRSVKKGRILSTTWRTSTVKNKYGEENVLKEICPKCSKKFKCFSAGIYENESGMMQWNYARFYIYLQIGVCSDLAMLCSYKALYFRTILAICFTLISLHLRHQ